MSNCEKPNAVLKRCVLSLDLNVFYTPVAGVSGLRDMKETLAGRSQRSRGNLLVDDILRMGIMGWVAWHTMSWTSNWIRE